MSKVVKHVNLPLSPRKKSKLFQLRKARRSQGLVGDFAAFDPWDSNCPAVHPRRSRSTRKNLKRPLGSRYICFKRFQSSCRTNSSPLPRPGAGRTSRFSTGMIFFSLLTGPKEIYITRDRGEFFYPYVVVGMLRFQGF